MTNERMDVALARRDNELMDCVLSHEAVQDFLADSGTYGMNVHVVHLYHFKTGVGKQMVRCTHDFSDYVTAFTQRIPMATDVTVRILVINGNAKDQQKRDEHHILLAVGCNLATPVTPADAVRLNLNLERGLLAIGDRTMTALATTHELHECLAKAIDGSLDVQMDVPDVHDPIPLSQCIAAPAFVNLCAQRPPRLNIEDAVDKLTEDTDDSALTITTTCQMVIKFKGMPNRQFAIADEAYAKRLEAEIHALDQHLRDLHEAITALDIGSTSVNLSGAPVIQRKGNRLAVEFAIVAGIDYPQEEQANAIAAMLREKVLMVMARLIGPAGAFPDTVVVFQKCDQTTSLTLTDPDRD
jgi:hypothetical protein